MKCVGTYMLNDGSAGYLYMPVCIHACTCNYTLQSTFMIIFRRVCFMIKMSIHVALRLITYILFIIYFHDCSKYTNYIAIELPIRRISHYVWSGWVSCVGTLIREIKSKLSYMSVMSVNNDLFKLSN